MKKYLVVFCLFMLSGSLFAQSTAEERMRAAERRMEEAKARMDAKVRDMERKIDQKMNSGNSNSGNLNDPGFSSPNFNDDNFGSDFGSGFGSDFGADMDEMRRKMDEQMEEERRNSPFANIDPSDPFIPSSGSTQVQLRILKDGQPVENCDIIVEINGREIGRSTSGSGGYTYIFTDNLTSNSIDVYGRKPGYTFTMKGIITLDSSLYADVDSKSKISR